MAEGAALWKGLALAEYRAGDFDAALKAETKALELRNPGSWSDCLLRALIHLGRGDREQARHWALGVFKGWASTTDDPEYLSLLRENEARLKELLPTDAEGVCAALEHAVEVQRRTDGPVPSGYASDLRLCLVDQLGVLGRYDQATALLEELRPAPDRKLGEWPTFCLGILALRRGDRDDHRALCAELLRQYAPEEAAVKEGSLSVKQLNPAYAAATARLCAAAPGTVEDPKRLLELGRRAAAAEDQDAHLLLGRGAAVYRAGQFAAAVEVLTRSVARFQEQPADELVRIRSWPYLGPAGRAQAHLFLAMAHHRLGHVEDTRRALAEADRALDQIGPETFQWAWAWRWTERILAEVLRRETGELLGIPSSTESKH
jgi:tetratricopeptide (TPR) repeat protein